MVDERFVFDTIVSEFLLNTFNKQKLKMLVSIIRNIDMLNRLTNIEVDLDLNELETEYINIIYAEDELDNKITSIQETTKEHVIKYLKLLGITLIEDKEDIYMYQIRNILTGIFNLFNTNITGAEYIVNSLRDEESEDIIIISELLEEYTSAPASEYYNIIQDVDETLIQNLIEYFTSIINGYDVTLDEETNNGIKILLLIDPKFNKTKVVKDMLTLGIKPNLLVNSLNSLYWSISNYQTDIDLVAYEIAATLFLCDDTEKYMLESLQDEIDLSLVDWIVNIEGYQEHILTLTTDLINQINTKARYEKI